MTDHTSAELVAEMRAFNRFYTRHLGALDEHLLDSGFSLAEARVLYDLGAESGWTSAALASALQMDRAYLSRILSRLDSDGLIARHPNPSDGRSHLVELTEAGITQRDALIAASDTRVGDALANLTEVQTRDLGRAMQTIRVVLEDRAAGAAIIRPASMGDISYAIHRQTVLYRDEFGWNDRFEALVLKISAEFMANQWPEPGRCWVAERDGHVLGSVFFVRGDDGEAILRMLYVEPDARGLGLGRRLAETSIAHARRMGYPKMRLWTNDVLTDARGLYDALGFTQTGAEPHADFGPKMEGQVLELAL